MSTPVFIGIDIATENLRAVAIDDQANPLASSNHPLAKVISASDNSKCQDVNSWIKAIDAALSDLAKK